MTNFIDKTTPIITINEYPTNKRSNVLIPIMTSESIHKHSDNNHQIVNVNDLSTSLQLFGWIDYLVFILMLIVCAVIGIYFGFVDKSGKITNKSTNNRNVEKRRGSEALDYLVGGRKMQVFPVSLSLVASFVSGISLLGTSTEVYVYGTQYIFSLLTIAFSGIISWYIFLPVFCNLQLTSTYEYFEMRFDNRIRLLASTLCTVNVITWLPIVIFVPALAFNQVTGVNIHIITPTVCLVCIFYTCVGGIKAVVWTDVIQSFVMLGSIILVMIKGTIDVGGLVEVFRRNDEGERLEAPELTFDPTVRYSILSILVGSSFHWLQNTICSQVMMQRFLSVPSVLAARQALLIFMIGVLIFLGCCSYNGLLIYATYHKCDPLSTKLAKAKDQLVPLLVMDILGIFPGLPGLFVAGVFSAALSSLSTGLNSLAAIFLEDFLKPYISQPLTEKQTAIFMRSVVVVFGIISVALVYVVEKQGMVLQLSMTLGATMNGPLLGIFFLGTCFPYINGNSALTGGVVAFIGMSWLSINHLIASSMGELNYPIKPVTTEGCTYNFHDFNTTALPHSTQNPFKDTSHPFYHMSFLYFTFVGTVLCIISGNLASLIFGRSKIGEINPKLLAPFLRNYLESRKYFSVPTTAVNKM